MDDVGVAEGAGTQSSDAAGDTGANSGREEGVDFSGTNNQEEGVDELTSSKQTATSSALHGESTTHFRGTRSSVTSFT